MPSTLTGDALLNEYPDAIDGDDAIMSAFMTDPDEKGDDAAPAKKKPSEKVEEEDEENANQPDADDETEDAEEPSEDEESEEQEDTDEAKEDEGDEDKSTIEIKDDHKFKITVDGAEQEFTLGSLKRLAGQEASLTRKSQEVADIRKNVEADQAKNIAAYDVLLKRSTERANQYRELPWTQLMKDPNVPADQLAALQAEAQKALEDEAFLKNEIDGFMKKVGDDQLKARQTSARDCLKALNDPESKQHIKGWNEALYNDLRTFATNEIGLPSEMVNNLTDAAAFKVLHMAMQFQRGASKVVTKKVNKTPTKIVKNSASAPAARASSKTVTVKQAVNKALKTGSQDDAINAFLAFEGDE
jgi:hypothetical protein